MKFKMDPALRKRKKKKKNLKKDFQFVIAVEDNFKALNLYLVEQCQTSVLCVTTRHEQICETQPIFM